MSPATIADFDLTGKVCIVTGGGRGIGRGMADGLYRHGATVVLTGRTQATLDEAAAEMGERAWGPACDVANETQVVALRDAVVARYGKIDVLVNNAGVNAIFKGIERTSLQEWQDIIDVNLTGVFLCCKYLGGAIGEGGSVINVSSVAGHAGLLRSVPYCASKGGVELLTKGLALDWAKRGVRVNTGPRLGRHRPDPRSAGARRARQAPAGSHATGPLRRAARHGGRRGVPGVGRLGVHDRAEFGDRWGVDGGVGGISLASKAVLLQRAEALLLQMGDRR